MKIYRMETDDHRAAFRDLSIEYMTWVFDQIKEHFGFEFDRTAREYVDSDTEIFVKLSPPEGLLLLCEIDGEVAGMAGLRRLTDGICEIKRLYVRPPFRGQGIARRFMEQLIASAKESQYSAIRLDSGGFMRAAHRVYRSFGFKEIDAYEGGEPPPELYDNWFFFERSLS